VIPDNYGTHKKCDPWLTEHPNIHFHFTHLSQLAESGGNLVWHSKPQGLRGLSSRSTVELRDALEAFIAAYSQNAEPFKWRKREVKGSQPSQYYRYLRN
jgi:hypothetical protein